MLDFIIVVWKKKLIKVRFVIPMVIGICILAARKSILRLSVFKVISFDVSNLLVVVIGSIILSAGICFQAAYIIKHYE